MRNPFPFASDNPFFFLSCFLKALPRKPVPVEAGDCAVCTPLLTHGEQVDVLDRLDFVLTNISELRKEVEELRNSLQHLAADIVGEVR